MNRLNLRNIGILVFWMGAWIYFYVVGKIIGWLEISAPYCLAIGIILILSDKRK